MLSNTESQLISQLQAIVSKAGNAREYMTVAEVAEYLHVSERWIRGLVRRQEIPHIRKEGKIIFVRTDIDRWMEQDRIRTSADISAIAATRIHTR